MAERAGQIGARLDIRSAPGRGTQVKVTLPLAPPPPEVSACLSHLRVLLVDDQDLFRAGLRNLLAARGIPVVGEASSGRQALDLAAKLQPDLVLMDLNMPEMDGLEATRTLREQNPAAKVVILTVNDQPNTLADALRAGAAGYLLKDLRARELFDLLEALGRGEQPISPSLAGRALQTWASQPAQATCPLTERQLEILRLAALELSSAQMAERVSLSEATVKYHLHQIFELLQVSNREQAVAVAARQGWIERRSK
jgi:DNA-binding NarL/FixJ family response regulator